MRLCARIISRIIVDLPHNWQISHNPTSSALSVSFMNDVLLYICNFVYSHDSANVSAADRAKPYKKSEVFFRWR